MAAKLDKEMLKKQHFWLLLIPVVIGLLLAWIGLFVSVADATDEKEKANNDAKAEVDRASAKARAVLKAYDGRKEDLFKLRTQRWKEMWDRQESVYEWPKSLGEDQIAKVKDLKFGSPISDDSFLSAFRDHYAKEYENVAADVAPLQFAGGWYSVLRHIGKWPRNPESEDVWLAAEDFWVEREMVRALNSVNKEAAKMTLEAAKKDDLRKRKFRNRTWELELELVDKSNAVAIQGTVRNLTHRLQPFNVNNELVFKVWLSEDDAAKPFLFAIEGASIDGDKTEKIKFVEKKHLVLDGNPRGLFRVEQVFDVRTAPVKRVDHLVLGYLSARHNEAELQMPAFSAKAVEAAAAEGGGNPAVGGGVGGPPPGMGPVIGGAGVGGGAATARCWRSRRATAGIDGPHLQRPRSTTLHQYDRPGPGHADWADHHCRSVLRAGRSHRDRELQTSIPDGTDTLCPVPWQSRVFPHIRG